MADARPAQIHVKLRRGAWEVEITCSEDRVREAIENVVAGLGAAASSPGMSEAGGPRGATTCRGLLQGLWSDGWFGGERTLGEVHEELGRRGYHYDRTAVSHALTDLVRENLLSRSGAARNYRYVQKRPPPS